MSSIFSAAQELRAQFLACREAWLAGLVADLEGGPPYETLRRLTDVHRLHLFDAVMQFRAVFADEASQVNVERMSLLLKNFECTTCTSSAP